MDLHFRRLVLGDIPDVLDLTKEIWEGNDYMPAVIDRWIRHEENYTFGAFSDGANHDLIGIAQVRWFSPGVAWLEGGRVRPSLQKQGAGVQIAAHAIEYVSTKGGKACLYDTSSENHGSIAIAKRFGFNERDRVRVSILETQDARFERPARPGDVLKFLPVEEAIATVRRIPNPPGDYISNGWSWAPLDETYLSRIPWRWVGLGKAIALVMDGRSDVIAESPEPGTSWIIVHGDPVDAARLVEVLFATREDRTTGMDERPREPFHSVFCPEPIASAIEALGFHPFAKKPEWVVLFEKRF